MADLVTLKIDDQEVEVPAGTLIVDAAKKIQNDIPVFCYHPKMDPVGMCRMCLVEVGTPRRDRETGETITEADGSPKIFYFPKLVTACTQPVSPGMAVKTNTKVVDDARQEVLEFLLTSHPLDCPICDKGGECPLQNLTMRHGPGNSRFLVDEKKKLAKHVPLGDLIYLDRERCIQCARCVRFQEELVDDAVIGFKQRGRALQIVTLSEPGFDSKWSGNTTDICPVGALTTADFRFGARPWELQHSSSLCTNCAIGCNTHLNTRRDGLSGDFVVKRVMPRQNEYVNEVWICDKGRFGHHYATSPDRITVPMIRREGGLQEATWDEALNLVADRVKAARGAVSVVAGEVLANEDMHVLNQLANNVGGSAVAWPGVMGGADQLAAVGAGVGTNFTDMGAGTAIVVIASDLDEEAPMWWMRVKQAADKMGATLDKSKATLIVANGRKTKLDRYATHSIRYTYGDEINTMLALHHAAVGEGAGLAADLAANDDDAIKAAGQAIADAENVIVIYGREGLDYAGSDSLAQACANLLIDTGHYGKPNNGLLGALPKANTGGAFALGIPAMADRSVADVVGDAKVVIVAGADPVGENDPLPEGRFTVVSELFMTETAQAADVVLPAQSFVEREGSMTNSERRVQRFFPALPAKGQARPDWWIFGKIGNGADAFKKAPVAAGQLMQMLSRTSGPFKGIDYPALAKVEEQWPDVGGEDKYYGGNAFKNSAGLGVQYPTSSENGKVPTKGDVAPAAAEGGALRAVPTTLMYNRGTKIMRSDLLHPRLPQPYVEINASDAEGLGIADGDSVSITVGDTSAVVTANVNGKAPQGAVLVPQSLGSGVIFNGVKAATVSKA